MALTKRDDNQSTNYTTGNTTVTVDVAAGDGIVVFIGSMMNGVYCTGVTDDIGNTYTVRPHVPDDGGNSELVFAYVESSIGTDATNVITATYNAANNIRKNMNASSWEPDSGDTITLDDASNKSGGWEDSPWETPSDLSTTGTDGLIITGVQSTSAITYTNHEIPSGIAAIALTDNGQGDTVFYRILTETITNEEAEVDPSGSQRYAIEVLAFKSEAGGGETLIMADLAHSHALDNVVLTQKHTIVIGGLEHSHSLDNITLTQKHSIIVNALEHTHSLDMPVLSQKHIIAVAGLDHSHSLDNVTLTQAHLLAIAGLDHSHALDNVILTQAHLLALAGIEHGHTLDNVALTQAHILADVADLTHSHSLDNIVLSLAGVLVVNSLTHGHSLDTPTLTQKHTLTVADLAHSHALDTIELSFGVTLVVNDLTHLQSLDGVDLLQAHVLIVDGLGHSHTIGSVILQGIDLIEIQELVSKGHLSIELVAAGSLSQELVSKGHLSQELISIMGDIS